MSHEPLSAEMLAAMTPADDFPLTGKETMCVYHGFVQTVDEVTGSPSVGGICCVCHDQRINEGYTSCPAHGLQPPEPGVEGCKVCFFSPEARAAVAAGLEHASGEAVAREVDSESVNQALVAPAGDNARPVAQAVPPAGTDTGGDAGAVRSDPALSGVFRFRTSQALRRIVAAREQWDRGGIDSGSADVQGVLERPLASPQTAQERAGGGGESQAEQVNGEA